MRLVGATIARNEADVIEAVVRHNLTVLDGLAIVDHGSMDGTSEILTALVREGLPLFVARDDSPAYDQKTMITGVGVFDHKIWPFDVTPFTQSLHERFVDWMRNPWRTQGKNSDARGLGLGRHLRGERRGAPAERDAGKKRSPVDH